MQAEVSPTAGKPGSGVGGLVARNALYLTIGQVLTIPISIVLNALLARFLGPGDFGYIYLVGTLTSFGFIVVDWGLHGALPGLVSRTREHAAALLGSSLFWRGSLSLVVYAILAVGSWLFGYDDPDFQWALALICLAQAFTSLVASCKDTIRGFERTDIPAVAHVAQQLLTLALVLPVLLLGGRMRAALAASALAVLLVLLPTWRALRSVGVTTVSVDRASIKALLVEGSPFVFFGAAMVITPNIDAIYLSKFAPPEVMGWFAAGRRLIGVLLLPASALIGALYPTLCRLQATDMEGFKTATRGALKSVSLVVVPVALGCALYPDIGVSIFSATFEPAEDNLRIMSLFLLLVYFTMPLGTAIMAAGRQRAWSLALGMCVVVSLVLDPIFVPWFQKRTGNGGLGVCVAGVVSEVLVVGAGLALIPKGILDRGLGRSILLALLSGGAMASVAYVTRGITPFVAAPLAVTAYALSLLLTGAIEKEQLAAVRGAISRRLARFKRAAG